MTRTLVLFAALAALTSACRGTGTQIEAPDAGDGPDQGARFPDANVITAIDGGPVDAAFVRPTLNEVQPSSGSEQGGTRVILKGTGFAEPAEVHFGDTEADSVVVLDEVSIAATTPAGPRGLVEVRVVTEGGESRLPDGFEYLAELRLDRVTPARVPEDGGVFVVLEGKGFDEDTLVYFDRIPLRGLRLVSGERIEGYVPRLAPGRPQIQVLHRQARIARGDLLFVYAVPRPTLVAPAVSTIAGLSDHELMGTGLGQTQAVSVGASKVERFDLQGPTLTTFVAPPLARGVYDLEVENEDATGRLEGGLLVYDPADVALAILGAAPQRVSAAGGELVTLVGSGFAPGASVLVGTATASVRYVSPHVLELVVPSGLAPGRHSIRLNQGASTVTQNDALVLYAPLSLVSITPNRSSVGLRTNVIIEGTGFVAPIEVRIADVPLTEVVIESETRLRGTIEAGADGAQDLLVRTRDEVAVLPGAFFFDVAFDLVRIEPAQGSMSGNTIVTAYGRGFAGAPAMKLGGLDGVSPRLENGQVFSARTPPSTPGRLDVSVVQTETKTLPLAYRYFDPRLLTGGAYGARIDGAINVGVISGDTGQPMPGMMVQLGYEANPRFARLTDENGLATISELDLYGPVTVTVGRTGFEFVTFMDLNAQNLSIFSGANPVNPDPPPPPQPCPTPSEGPVVRGKVFKFKSTIDPVTRPGWIPVAQITYSESNVFSPNPPEPATQFDFVFQDGGEYEITPMRGGTIAVYAILGDYNQSSQVFIPRRFGMVRQVPSVPGEITEGIHISLDFNLDQSVQLRLDDPPRQMPGPSGNIVFPFLNLLSEGVIPFNPQVALFNPLWLDNMPDVSASSFIYMTGSMTERNGQYGAPFSLTLVTSGLPFSEGVDAGPFLRMAQNMSPKAGELLEDGRISFEQAGIVPEITRIEVVDSTVVSGSCCVDLNMNGLCESTEPVQGGGAPVQFNRWSLFAQGGLQSYYLPRMAPGVSAFVTPRTYPFIMQQAIAPRFNYREFIYNQFSPFFWRSWMATFGSILVKEETD
jgi:hypothetical protein